MRISARERGLTLIEVTIAAAIGTVLLATLVMLVHQIATAAARLDADAVANGTANALLERLESESASAWAIWIPAADVLGNANTDGHELDFFAEDASHRIYAWAYCFDSGTATITRYAYAPGRAIVAGETYAGLSSFNAAAFDARSITETSSEVYDPLLSAASVTDSSYDFGVMSGALGGNGFVRVQIGGSGFAAAEMLASATAPSHFTIVATYTPAPSPLGLPTPTPLPLGTFSP